MKQLTQKLKSGQMQVLKVPVPDLRPGMVLVQNAYSLISAGTEASTVKTARKSYIGKAKERPQQVKQVIDSLKSQGPVQTYRAVMKKLDAYSPLGYSSAGVVIEVGEGVGGFAVGDKVACAGVGYANHAEVVSVPVNLCVSLSQSSQSAQRNEDYLKMAAYNTLGAIAMQGARQADLRLGESCAVIGLGLIGQLTAVLLRAAGIRVIGIDIEQAMVELGREHCLDLALLRDDPGIESKILEFSSGIGCDGVIITAASDSNDPINFAGAISRKKGTIVVVGAVPTGFDREHFYKKELTVKMSCSYGPGRYDPEYEEKGRDYPVSYVRWTEKRNMQAFQELIASGKIDISYLTTHVFKLEDAPKAYDMIVERSEPYIGILIEYDRDKETTKGSVQVRPPTSDLRPPTSVSIGFIGAGSYAQSYLLPNISKGKDMVLKGVMTSTSTSSRSVADRFGFEFCTGNEEDILQNDEINTVFIATRHDSHGYYVKKALEAGKNVFVEKPLCLTIEELEGIKLAYQLLITNNESQITSNGVPLLMVGYNRRFSPLTKMMKEKITTGPMSMIYRINAGAIPADSWIQDMEIGGGRIIGEVCHFIDYLTFVNGSLPVSVYAAAMKDAQCLNDTVNVSLSFENGSIGTISYFANGSKFLPKEYIEIHNMGATLAITGFRQLEVFTNRRDFQKKLFSQDKGQKGAVAEFLKSVKNGRISPISFEEIYTTSLVAFKAIESLKAGKAIKIG